MEPNRTLETVSTPKPGELEISGLFSTAAGAAAGGTGHRAPRRAQTLPDCGEVAVATFPEQVGQPVHYGARLQAVAVCLKNYGLLPLAGISELLREAIVGQPVVVFDETGTGIDGQL